MQQGRFADLTTRLGLSPSLLLEGEAPQGISRERIADMLEDTAAKAGVTDKARLGPGRGLKIACAAGRRLIAIDAPGDAEYLSQAAHPDLADAPEMVQLRLQALLRAGDHQRPAAEIDRQCARPDLPGELREILRDFLINPTVFSRLPALHRHHDLLWGDLEPDLLGKIASFRQMPERMVQLPPSLEANLLALRSVAPADAPGFVQDLRWGATIQRYIKFLRACAFQLPAPAGREPRDTGPAAVLRGLVSQLKDMTRIDSAEALDREVSAGRTIVICMAHAGVAVGSQAVARRANLPIASVAAGNRASADRAHVATSEPGSPQQLLKLVKAVRKTQHLVVIAPDGARGQVTERDLLGRKVAIGQGAALIARKSVAATFFARSVWSGQGIDIELTQGPTAAPDCDPRGYDEEFHAFYTAQLERIVRGQAVDMAPNGNFWNAFA